MSSAAYVMLPLQISVLYMHAHKQLPPIEWAASMQEMLHCHWSNSKFSTAKWSSWTSVDTLQVIRVKNKLDDVDVWTAMSLLKQQTIPCKVIHPDLGGYTTCKGIAAGSAIQSLMSIELRAAMSLVRQWSTAKWCSWTSGFQPVIYHSYVYSLQCSHACNTKCNGSRTLYTNYWNVDLDM